MSTVLTIDEAHQMRESARDRHTDARSDYNSWAAVIAEDAVRRTGMPGWTTAAEVSGDQLIIARAAVFEARADWLDSRQLCGLKPVAS